jgi:hypothetical protein
MPEFIGDARAVSFLVVGVILAVEPGVDETGAAVGDSAFGLRRLVTAFFFGNREPRSPRF